MIEQCPGDRLGGGADIDKQRGTIGNTRRHLRGNALFPVNCITLRVL